MRSDSPADLAIPEIQGLGHRSPHVGRQVRTEGIVTAVERRGFYLQAPEGTKSPVSRAIFVFTKTPPTVSVGDRIRVVATVEEFKRGTGQLASTQLSRNPKITILASKVRLPAPIALGSKDWPLPTGSLYEAGLAYEQLEGMLVRVPPSRVIGATDHHGDVYVAPEAPGTGLPIERNSVVRGRVDKVYPARIKLTFGRILYGQPAPKLDVGDRIGPVEGPFVHDHGFFGLKPTTPVDATSSRRKRQVTSLVGTEWGLTVATFNMENLDPVVESADRIAEGGRPDDDIGSGKLAALAQQIVDQLRCPDIVAVQEVQDNDGTESSTITDASKTWSAIIDAVVAAGGTRYQWVDRPPKPNADGGQPGGNIRVGYLYAPDRVSLDEETVQRIGENDEAFAEGRKSLAARFVFRPTGQRLYAIVNHWASKHGSTPTYRDPNMPQIVGGIEERTAQQMVIERFVNDIVNREPKARILSVGDFNAPDHEAPIVAHGSGALFNLGELVPDYERYSYIFQGIAEPIDHQFASRVLKGNVEFEYVHVNAAFAEKATDHDPTISRIDMR